LLDKIYRLSDKSTSAVPVELWSRLDCARNQPSHSDAVIRKRFTGYNAALIVELPPVARKADVHCGHP
jgi:hypothetical protein